MREPRTLAEELKWRILESDIDIQTLRQSLGPLWSNLDRYIDTQFKNRPEKNLARLAEALNTTLTYVLEPNEGVDVQSVAACRNKKRDGLPVWLSRAQRAELEDTLKSVQAPTIHKERFFGWYLGESRLHFPGDPSESKVHIYYLLAWLKPEENAREPLSHSGLPSNCVIYEEGGDSMAVRLDADHRWDLVNASASGTAYQDWRPSIDLCAYEYEGVKLLSECKGLGYYLVSAGGKPVAGLKSFIDFLERIMR